MSTETPHCGVVAVIGAPNAGKSTLVNALVGQKVAITSAKAQTTRARLLGIALLDQVQIILADISMSLDNVLAVAGAARDHKAVLWIGLALSILLMAVASSFIARILDRYHWVAWIGFAIIVYVALDMIWAGTHEVVAATGKA